MHPMFRSVRPRGPDGDVSYSGPMGMFRWRDKAYSHFQAGPRSLFSFFPHGRRTDTCQARSGARPRPSVRSLRAACARTSSECLVRLLAVRSHAEGAILGARARVLVVVATRGTRVGGFAARCPSAAPMRPRAWSRDTWRLSPRTPFILIFSPSARAYSHSRALGRPAFAFVITGSGRIGGATDMFAQGATPAMLQMSGRWDSVRRDSNPSPHTHTG